MFFFNNSFVSIKVRVMLSYLEFMDIFFKTNTKKCNNSNNTWACYDTLIHEIVAFEMRINQDFWSLFESLSGLKVPGPFHYCFSSA